MGAFIALAGQLVQLGKYGGRNEGEGFFAVRETLKKTS
jgi:hypothetical protein